MAKKLDFTRSYGARRYNVTIFKDLLDDWVVDCTWWSSESNMGKGSKIFVCDTDEGLERLLIKIKKRRAYYGFNVV